MTSACLLAFFSAVISLVIAFFAKGWSSGFYMAICYAIILMMHVTQVRLMASNGMPLYTLVMIVLMCWMPPIILIKIIIFEWSELDFARKLQVQIYGLLGSVAITIIALSEINFREKVKALNRTVTSFRLTVVTIYRMKKKHSRGSSPGC